MDCRNERFSAERPGDTYIDLKFAEQAGIEIDGNGAAQETGSAGSEARDARVDAVRVRQRHADNPLAVKKNRRRRGTHAVQTEILFANRHRQPIHPRVRFFLNARDIRRLLFF